MIALKCPHCHVGLKVDEGKIPLGITFFKCPKCKGEIPVSLLNLNSSLKQEDRDNTVLVSPPSSHKGKLTVLANEETEEQILPLEEGTFTIGRLSSLSQANLPIRTKDRSMSREHIRIEVKKDTRGNYKHFLSDNNSKNHTLYNGRYLENGEIVVLKDNDEIIIGRTILRFND